MLSSILDKTNLFQSRSCLGDGHSICEDHLNLTIDSNKSYLEQSFSTKVKSVTIRQDSSASFSADDTKIFFERIGDLANLERLQVRFAEGVAIPYQALGKLLNKVRRLHQFDLNCFDITANEANSEPNGFLSFIESLKNHPSLMDFKLSFSHQSHGATTLDSIFQAVAQVPTLQKLVLYVKSQLSSHEHISIRLSYQSIGSICFASNLKTLKLYGITLDKELVCFIVKPSLKILTLLNCGLTYESAIKLASMLETNNTLEKVDLSRNNIGDTGCIAIANALRNNSTLQGLYLFQDKNISKQSCEALQYMLECNFTLQDLWTSIDDEDFNETVKFYLNLNRQGTRHILRKTAATNEEWAVTLSSHQNDLPSLFYYLSRNPLIFCS